MALRVVDDTLKLLGITEAMRSWQSVIDEVDGKRRDRIAGCADAIAGTLAPAQGAYETLELDPT